MSRRGIRIVARAGDGMPEQIVDVADTPQEAETIVDCARSYEVETLGIVRPIETEPDR